jgi:lysophospholipase L1-like esterase
VKPPLVRRRLRLVAANLFACVLVLVAAEGLLAIRVPRDGWHRGTLYTFGVPVVEENNFRAPVDLQPADGAPRVVVLGDSLTWGVGLRIEERYTEIAEELLRRRGHRLEIVNLGRSNGDLWRSAVALERFGMPLDPEVVVVGFCVNDTQPAPQDTSPERTAVRRSAPFTLLRTVRFYLPRLAHRMEMALWAGLERAGRVPTWWQALDRTYDPASPEWQAFVGGLARIRELAGERRLVFFALNQGVRSGAATDYSQPDEVLRDYLFRWYAQAAEAAAEAGFEVIDVHHELVRLGGFDMSVNPHDAHPSARLNAVYGRRLADLLAPLRPAAS